MTRKTFTNDMTMMYVMHDALRREMDLMAQLIADPAKDPRRIMADAPGWQMFRDYLHVHHGAEDDVLWPAIRQAVADKPGELAVLEALEAEHAAVDPGLEAIDAAIADADSGSERLAGIIPRLVTGLGKHLAHEEDEGLALIDAYAKPELLRSFGAEHSMRIGDGTPRFLPWLLDGASEEDTSFVLGQLPEPVRGAYQNAWQPAYAELSRWVA